MSDALEDALVARFLPRFFVDSRECAELPAEFESYSVEPRVKATNGTLYARVSPSRALGGDVAALEIQYYHLWARDCGFLRSHPLDVEHVSTLVVAESAEAKATDWKALYWYAAAHEGTVCDASNAARADALGASEGGPAVWISAGKHASYLSLALCQQRGCGGDDCRVMEPLPAGAVRNLGESGAPLDGALFLASPSWPLSEKLDSDFPPELLSRLDTSPDAVVARVHGHWRTAQFTISIGNDALTALGTSGHHGASSLERAEASVETALGKTFGAIGRALGASEKGDPR